jgi:mannose-6-phosphate isomerase
MGLDTLGLLRFHDKYFERIWGGQKLRTLYGKAIPAGALVGEAWLVADHPQHESVVADGPWRGMTLRGLLDRDPGAVLGRRPECTIHGRFPLMLKILDARDILSVQVHPDDACARALRERDVGKTEMWHVLHAAPDTQLVCGLDPHVTPETLTRAVQDAALDPFLIRCEVSRGMSVFVPAGTVHAIGAGAVLAEIQQNSDLTYRLYDWGRVDVAGKPRELHLDKALQAIHFGSAPRRSVRPLRYALNGADCDMLAACPYFAAEHIHVSGLFERPIARATFHILLVTEGDLLFRDEASKARARPGEALLVPGNIKRFTASGAGSFLDYYVPDLRDDVAAPLAQAGYAHSDIAALGEGLMTV